MNAEKLKNRGERLSGDTTTTSTKQWRKNLSLIFFYCSATIREEENRSRVVNYGLLSSEIYCDVSLLVVWHLRKFCSVLNRHSNFITPISLTKRFYRMNQYCVPEFEMDDDYSIPSSSAQNRPRKSSVGPEDDIMELLWQDGQVVMQSQNQRSGKKQPRYDAVAPPDQPNQHLFMEEDEMASWLHYPLNDAAFDQDFCADLLYPNTAMDPPDTASFVAAAAGSSKPPIPAPRRAEAVQNFAHFSRHKAAATMVESCDTPAGNVEKEATTYDLTSSPGCSSASAEPAQNPAAEDRKRKGRERSDDSEDVEFESADAKKQARGSTSTKRARAAEVHNLSERRRRDRINEKMKALQELIPRCNKSDKASMLDEAIEYLKSLQLQVQMMSMGCSMVPMMYLGMQQYMPPMGLGMGMGMGIGMEMGMNRPMMHFPNVLPGSAMPPATAAPGHLGPRFPMPPPFPMPPVPAPPDQSRTQGNNQSDTVQSNNPLSMQNPNQPRIPHFADHYQQYFGFQQMQLPPPPQNQGMAQASTSRGGAENPENDRPG